MNANESNAYLHAICPQGVPAWLADYAQAPEMARLRGVGLFCGTDYSRVYSYSRFYSRFDHSLAAALIVWRFTGDRKQAIAGLLHDIATPVFSHCVDFMNGDALTQSSTEARTHGTIARSQAICALLARDGLALDDVADYHRYPVADNDSPCLSADRLEYTLSTNMICHGGWDAHDVRGFLDDLAVLKDERGADELGFQSIDAAGRFTVGACEVGRRYQTSENKLLLHFLGDIVKAGVQSGCFTVEALYARTEPEIIDRLARADDARVRAAWRAYTQLDAVRTGDERPQKGYAVDVAVKKRYIHPLVRADGITRRAADVSDTARAAVEGFLAYRDTRYGWIDFAFDDATV